MTDTARLFDDSSPRRLWLVRHGRSTWNALGLVQGQVPVPRLTANGLVQARRCAAGLRGEPVAAVYSSDLRRAVQTAQPIARALGVGFTVDRRLRERSLGTAEGTPASLFGPGRSGVAFSRVVDADAAPTEGESIRQLYRRVTGFLTELAHKPGEGDVVVVTHGSVIRAALAWLDGLGPDEMMWPPIEHGSAIRRELATVRAPSLQLDTTRAPSLQLVGVG